MRLKNVGQIKDLAIWITFLEGHFQMKNLTTWGQFLESISLDLWESKTGEEDWDSETWDLKELKKLLGDLCKVNEIRSFFLPKNATFDCASVTEQSAAFY